MSDLELSDLKPIREKLPKQRQRTTLKSLVASILLAGSLFACSHPASTTTEPPQSQLPLQPAAPTPERAPLRLTILADHYLPELKEAIFPPAPGSKGQARDEKELLELQAKQTKEDCEKAIWGEDTNLHLFYGQPNGPLTDQEVEVLSPFFDQLANDTDYYTQLIKKEFPRKRPFLYIKGVTTCAPPKVTRSFPSGHATVSKVFALALSELIPSKRADFNQQAERVGKDRVRTGLHHPSDVRAGQKLAELLFAKFKATPRYRELFETYRKKLPKTGP